MKSLNRKMKSLMTIFRASGIDAKCIWMLEMRSIVHFRRYMIDSGNFEHFILFSESDIFAKSFRLPFLFDPMFKWYQSIHSRIHWGVVVERKAVYEKTNTKTICKSHYPVRLEKALRVNRFFWKSTTPFFLFHLVFIWHQSIHPATPHGVRNDVETL